MTVLEFLGLLVFAFFVYGAFKFAQEKKGSRKSGASGKVTKPKEDKKK